MRAIFLLAVLGVAQACDPAPSSEKRHLIPHQVGDVTIMRFYDDDGLTHDIQYEVREVTREKDGSLLITRWSKSTLPEGLFDPPGSAIKSPAITSELPRDRVRSTGNGLYLVEEYEPAKEKLVKLDTPRLNLKLPLVEGGTWTGKEDDWSTTATIGKPEKIKVLAGTWEATPVRMVTTFKSDRKSMKRTFWFVPGIGNIRTDMDGEIVAELVSFTPAKKK